MEHLLCGGTCKASNALARTALLHNGLCNVCLHRMLLSSTAQVYCLALLYCPQYHLRHMLYIVAMLELLDGTQTIMSGVISVGHAPRFNLHPLTAPPVDVWHVQAPEPFVPSTMLALAQGAGKQKYGAVINLVAFYVFAIPVALLLGFWGHLGVEGMYM